MVMKFGELWYFQWTALCALLVFAPFICSDNHGNAANVLVELVNKNRTSLKAHSLSVSPGLGCVALQYAKTCQENCSSTNNTIFCEPPEDYFTEIFAPNCGVELPTFGTISGQLLGCQYKYLEPPEAFSRLLVQDQRSLLLVRNKSFTQVGVGIIGKQKHKGPYIWCVLFSTSQRNTSFVLDDLGKGIVQKRGCYSGNSITCSAGCRNSGFFMLLLFLFLSHGVHLSFS